MSEGQTTEVPQPAHHHITNGAVITNSMETPHNKLIEEKVEAIMQEMYAVDEPNMTDEQVDRIARSILTKAMFDLLATKQNIPTDSKPIEDWEKEFQTKFNWKGIFGENSSALNAIKAFISDLLATREAQMIEAVDENTSDGYHTFKELYGFRKAYNAALFNEWAKARKYNVHKSRRHADGEECFGGGWFIVMATLPTGQISNHYELSDWELFQCDERERGDVWDGHTPQDVLDRLLALLRPQQQEEV